MNVRSLSKVDHLMHLYAKTPSLVMTHHHAQCSIIKVLLHYGKTEKFWATLGRVSRILLSILCCIVLLNVYIDSLEPLLLLSTMVQLPVVLAYSALMNKVPKTSALYLKRWAFLSCIEQSLPESWSFMFCYCWALFDAVAYEILWFICVSNNFCFSGCDRKCD